ncbi:unnamed protein product, partial [Brenthis ino]
MRLLILTVSFWALASAKPETYKEKEDFQFSRSSSDDGSKSGYYGAQRGNMGGNYEKAHNMDSLAQHQMSTLVRQVDGELGEAANTRTGSVFTSGNSRGIYGSGNYDLSNLKGRNFVEGTSYDDLYASSLLAQNTRNHASVYSANNNARYSTSQLQASGVSDGYQSGRHTSQYAQADNQQAESQYRGSNSYEYGNQGASQYKYYTHGGSQAINEYDQSNAHLQSGSNYNANVRPKLVSATPVRVYVRPGTTVTIPVAAQTYDASQSYSTQDRSVVNTDADALFLNNAKINIIKPLSAPKHYESSYSYHKEWEKHDTKPVTIIPTENPFPENSELHEDAQTYAEAGRQYQSEADSINILNSNLNKAQSSNLNSAYSSGYSSNTNSVASNRLRYLSQTQNLAAVDAASNVYNVDTQSSGASSKLNSNLNVLDLNSKPKSYQSSYSYHKAWERRGDPYVIKPVGSDLSTIPIVPTKNPFLDNSELYEDSQLSEATGQQHQSEVDSANVLTSNIKSAQSSILNSAYSSGYSGNVKSATTNRLRSQMQNSATVGTASNAYKVDSQSTGALSNLNSNLNVLDLNSKPKSYQSSYSYHKSWERRGDPYVIKPAGSDLGTQSQRLIADSSNQGVHSYSQYGSQYNQHSYSQDDCVEGRKKRSYSIDSYLLPTVPNSQDKLDQQSIYGWDNLGQQSERLGLQDLPSLSQYTQNNEELGQQIQNPWGSIEGQETQNSWGDLGSFNQHQSQIGRLEDLGQQTQNTWDHFENLGQQTQNGDEKLDLSQQTQNTWNNLENFSQQLQKQEEKLDDQQSFAHLDQFRQQTQNDNGKLEDLGQQTQNTWDHLDNMGQQIQVGKLEDLGQQTQNTLDHLDNMDQQIQAEKLEDLGQQTQNTWDHLDNMGQQILAGKLEDLGQQTQNTWDHLDNMGQQIQAEKLEDLGQQTQSTWDHLDNIDGQQIQAEKLEDLGQQTQSTWDHLDNIDGQQIQTGKLEDLGQQTQNTWDHLDNMGQQIQAEKLEDLGQQTQNTWDHLDNMGQQIQAEKLEDLGQQTQSTWDHLDNIDGQQIQTGKLEDLGQQIQTDKLEDLGQQTQNTWDHLDNIGGQRIQTGKVEDLGQQIQTGKLEDLGQQTQNTWDHLDNMGQQIQTGKLEDLGQQIQNTWNKFENLGQQTQSDNEQTEDMGQQTQSTWDNLGYFGQQLQNQKEKIENIGQQNVESLQQPGQQTQNTWDDLENLGQHSQTQWNKENQQTQDQWSNLESIGQQTQNQWDKIESLIPQSQGKFDDQQTQNAWNKVEVIPQETRILEEQKQNELENFAHENLNIATQEYLNFWNSMNIHEQTQNNFNQENIQASNEQLFHQQNFDSWPHSSQKLIPNSDISLWQQTTNGKESTLWDAVDKIIKESEKKEKNDDSIATSNNEMEDKNIRPTDIGRGDIGPEDIPTVSLENKDKINEHSHSIPKVSTDNNIQNKQENPIILDVIGLEKQDFITSSASKPKQQSSNQYKTKNYEDAQIPENIEHEDNLKNIETILKMQNNDVQYNNDFFKHNQELSNFEQQNINEKIDQVNIEVTTKWSHEYHQKSRSQTFENIEMKTNVKNEVLQPVEITTVKPGFWKSVWDKTASAKDKIVSWFKN